MHAALDKPYVEQIEMIKYLHTECKVRRALSFCFSVFCFVFFCFRGKHRSLLSDLAAIVVVVHFALPPFHFDAFMVGFAGCVGLQPLLSLCFDFDCLSSLAFCYLYFCMPVYGLASALCCGCVSLFIPPHESVRPSIVSCAHPTSLPLCLCASLSLCLVCVCV